MCLALREKYNIYSNNSDEQNTLNEEKHSTALIPSYSVTLPTKGVTLYDQLTGITLHLNKKPTR